MVAAMSRDEDRLPKLDRLLSWRDDAFRSAAANMGLDEACLEFSSRTGLPVIRFYRWDHPARTIGYFDPHPEAGRASAPGQDVVRRFTGGGTVDHGDDATFALCLPPGLPASLGSSSSRYRWIHEALTESLSSPGEPAVRLIPPNTPSSSGPCFSSPVPWDLVDADSNQKIAGGAQRRSRGAVLHQGSVRVSEARRSPFSSWITAFFGQLADAVESLTEGEIASLLVRGKELARRRYESEEWNQRR